MTETTDGSIGGAVAYEGLSDIPESLLTAGGIAGTDERLLDWVDERVDEIRQTVGAAGRQAHLWGYREPEHAVALDVWSESGDVALTFRIGDRLELFGKEQIVVPDVFEALHLSGLILAALDIRPAVGRQD